MGIIINNSKKKRSNTNSLMGVIMKKVKTIIAMMLIMSIVFGILGCNTIEQVEELSAKDFKNALEDVFDANDDEIVETQGEGYDILYFPDRRCLITYDTFDNEDVARSIFEMQYNQYENIEKDYELDGVNRSFDENMGYIVVRTSDEVFMEEFGTEVFDEIIFAYYYSGSMYISIFCADNDIDDALEFIECLGLPHV